MSAYEDLIAAVTNGVINRLTGERGTRLDKAWGALSQKARDERIEECRDFVDNALERGRGTLMDEWRR